MRWRSPHPRGSRPCPAAGTRSCAGRCPGRSGLSCPPDRRDRRPPAAGDPAEPLLEQDRDVEDRHGPGDVRADVQRVIDDRATGRSGEAATGTAMTTTMTRSAQQEHRTAERTADDRHQVTAEQAVIQAPAARDAAQPDQYECRTRCSLRGRKCEAKKRSSLIAPRTWPRSRARAAQHKGPHRLHHLASDAKDEIESMLRDGPSGCSIRRRAVRVGRGICIATGAASVALADRTHEPGPQPGDPRRSRSLLVVGIPKLVEGQQTPPNSGPASLADPFRRLEEDRELSKVLVAQPAVRRHRRAGNDARRAPQMPDLERDAEVA